MNENQISYYAIIPATIRYDKRLKPAEKLIYGEITALANRNGYCFASNKYFANLYKVTIHTVSQWISNLTKLKYVDIVIIRNEKKEVIERRIYIIDNPKKIYVEKSQYPYVYFYQEGIDKNVQENNINDNIDRLFNFIINKKEIPYDLKISNINNLFNILEKQGLLYTKEMLESYTKENINKIKIIIYAIVTIYKTKHRNRILDISREKLIEIYNRCEEKKTEISSFINYYVSSIINELEKF